MTLAEIIALASVVISIGTNVGLYVHLSSVTNSRFESLERKMDARFDAVDRKFESVERRLGLIQCDLHQMDIRLTKLEK